MRRFAGFACALVLALCWQVGAAPAASAGWNDVIHRLDASYTILHNGDVTVTQVIDYEFGAEGRPGVVLQVPSRLPWDSSRDAVHTVSDVRVSSPTGAATEVSTREIEDGGVGRVRLRIGDPKRPADRAETYVVSYTITSVTEAQPGFDEFVWDASGGGLGVGIEQMTVMVEAPGGVQNAHCFVDADEEIPCARAGVDESGRGQFIARNLGPNDPFHVAALLLPGAVDPGPTLVPRPEPVRRTLLIGGLGMIASTLLMAAAALWLRRRVLTASRPSTPRHHRPEAELELDPPAVPPGEAALLADGHFGPQHTAATLFDLATRGALRVGPAVAGEARVSLRDPGVAARPYEQALIAGLFDGSKPGTTVTIGPRRSIQQHHAALQNAVCATVTDAHWFPRRPTLLTAPTLLALFLGAGAVLALSGLSLSGVLPGPVGLALIVAATLAPIVIGAAWLRRWRRWDTPTAKGHAVRDQVRRHRDSLAALEADQVPAGSVVIGRSLPWAVSVHDTERWASIAQEAIMLGRVPDDVPSWWEGKTFSPFDVIAVADALEAAAVGAVEWAKMGRPVDGASRGNNSTRG